MSEQSPTLTEAIRFFANPQNCVDAVAAMRWPDGKPTCPVCGKQDHYWLATQWRWKCKACKKQFSVKVGTVFEDSPLSLDKWLVTLWMLVNCKNGVSSYEVAATIGVTQKSAWFMLQRLRKALQDEHNTKLGGRVEVDESFIGGKARNMHVSKRLKKMEMANRGGKSIAFGILERGGKVRAMVVSDRERSTLQGKIKHHVEPGAEILTDELHSYWGLEKEYVHQIVNHAAEYVRGHVHTNGLENFWSLVKRCLNGTYVSVAPFHLFRYLDEQSFRFNNRSTRDGKVTNSDRFAIALSQIAGKRLTYAEVGGRVMLTGSAAS
jgi:transposase-like protein